MAVIAHCESESICSATIPWSRQLPRRYLLVRENIRRCSACGYHLLARDLGAHAISCRPISQILSPEPVRIPKRLLVRKPPSPLLKPRKRVVTPPAGPKRLVNAIVEEKTVKQVLWTDRARLAAGNQIVTSLNWEFLPPGEWNTKRIKEYCDLLFAHEPKYLPERIEQLATIRPRPQLIAIGLKGVREGYTAYQIPSYTPVILECPLLGNATYVFFENWQLLSTKSKGELRDRYRTEFEKCNHRAEHWRSWRRDIEKAVKGIP